MGKPSTKQTTPQSDNLKRILKSLRPELGKTIDIKEVPVLNQALSEILKLVEKAEQFAREDELNRMHTAARKADYKFLYHEMVEHIEDRLSELREEK